MKIAVTGGIGSGKSYFCRLLADYGIAVYDCDAGAKRLMAHSERLQEELRRLVGEGVYIDHVLQKSVLAKFLLASEANKLAVDEIVHPAVAADFLSSGLDWLESAILFDSGFCQRVHFDKIVCVSAPLEVRIRRVMERDGISRAGAMEWIGRQMAQQEVEKRSNYVVVNDGRDLHRQIIELLKQINDK